MTTFNIRDSKVSQLNSEADNIKIINSNGAVNLSTGNSAQANGDHSKACSNVGKESSLFSYITAAFKLLKRWFAGPVPPQ